MVVVIVGFQCFVSFVIVVVVVPASVWFFFFSMACGRERVREIAGACERVRECDGARESARECAIAPVRGYFRWSNCSFFIVSA